MMRKIYSAVFLTLHLFLFSQGENNHWYFGNGAAVNFNSPTNPQVLTNSNMYAGQRPVGSISDANGNLLFYTDGKYIWNREHQIMQNGTLNTGGWNPYGIQLSILPDPSNSNKYYIFTPMAFYNNNTGKSCYTVIDMSLGNIGANGLPLGDVMQNNNSIPLVAENELSFSANNVNIVKHSDNSSFWVVIPNKNKLYSYLVNNQGLVNTPIVSTLPLNIPNYSPTTHASYLKISPKVNVSNNFSNYLYISHWGGVNATDWASIKVLSFNNTTGKITSDFDLNITTNPGASCFAEFNNTGSILYIVSNGGSSVYGIDMTNISSSVNYYLLPINYSSNSAGPTDIQRNKFGDIYMSFEDSNGYLAKILNQNSFNNGSIDVNSLYLQGKTTSLNLPQLVQAKNNIGTCAQDISLISPENNNTFTYRAANTIVTQTNYSTDSNQNIQMKAGSSILLSPNTSIKSKFLATIENCVVGSNVIKQSEGSVIFPETLKLTLDLRTNNIAEKGDIKIYPNPVVDYLSIISESDILKVNIYDVSGRNMKSNLNGDKIDVTNLNSGNYIINIETKEGKTSKKFIKK